MSRSNIGFQPDGRLEPKAIQNAGRGGAVVLLVEDEDDLREPLAFRFRQAGFTVREAPDGHEAFEILAGRGVDAVLCDIRMPRCDGVTLLKRLRAVGIHTPFAFVTADGSQQAHDLLHLRSQAVFTKPFDVNALIDWVRASVEDARSEATGEAPAPKRYVSVVPLDATGNPQEGERFFARLRGREGFTLRLSITPRPLAVGIHMRVRAEDVTGPSSVELALPVAHADARLLRATRAGHGKNESLELAFLCDDTPITGAFFRAIETGLPKF